MTKVRPLYIFNLDGTLTNTEHRIHHIVGPQKNWDAFYKNAGSDTPKQSVMTLAENLSHVADIGIWAMRYEEYWTDTLAWLKKYMPWFDPRFMRMREEGNMQTRARMIQTWFAELSVLDQGRLKGAFETQGKYASAWNRINVPCFVLDHRPQENRHEPRVVS